MKSAYELALERMEQQGIERPDQGSLTDEDRAEMADIRQRAEAKLAQLHIMHTERLAKLSSFGEREHEEKEYRIERRRIEDGRESKLEAIRQRKKTP
ncbi:MAG: hypothetical protein AAGM22_27985 [Acidobacteriota bacterium]